MRFSLALGVLAMSVAACDCKGPGITKDQCKDVVGVEANNTTACTTSAQCGDHYSCKTPMKDAAFMCCVLGDRPCTTEGDCCPGQTCNDTRKLCFDKTVECSTDPDCGDKGDRFCEDWTDRFGTTKRCRFHTCSSIGECPEGQSCFQGECMAQLPCEGACPTGQGCVPTIDRCQDYSKPTGREMAACPMSCNAGFIATFNDARNIWDTCNLPPVKCVCAELPALRSEDLGRFSALTIDPGKNLWASTYDGQFGDLAVVQYDATGKRIRIEYVDGVPTSGTVKYGPSGARGGVEEPGDDVGRYTDIAMGQNGVVYASYYDVTNGNLRFAYRTSDGKWTTMRVDGENTDTGLYTSVAIDQDGIPGISYFQKGADAAFDASTCPGGAPTGPKAFITALKFAKASSPTPGPGDWTIKTLGCQSRPTPACYQCANVCADVDNAGPACLMGATTCPTACDNNTEICVMAGATAKCGKKYNPSNLQDIPEGVGLFSALTFNGKEAFIAYMKREKPAATMANPKPAAKGTLYGVNISAAGTVVAPVLIDGNGDTGFFPDVKVDPVSKKIALSYHDFSSKALKYYAGLTFTPGQMPEIIDPGTGASGSGENDWVGTDSAVMFGTGAVYVVYQDPTKGDLKLAKKTGTAAWTILPSVSTTGAVGFFADGVVSNGKLFTSHARIHAKLIGGEPHVDNSLILDALDPAP